AAFRERRIRQQLGGVEDRTARDAHGAESLHRLVLRPLLGPRLDHRIDFFLLLRAAARALEAWIVAELGTSEHSVAPLPHFHRSAMDVHVVVRAEGPAAEQVGRRRYL